MPNIESAKKAVRQTIRRTLINKARKSNLKTSKKAIKVAISAKGEVEAKKLFLVYESKIMRAVTKGLIKRNTAARELRKLATNIRNLKEKTE